MISCQSILVNLFFGCFFFENILWVAVIDKCIYFPQSLSLPCVRPTSLFWIHFICVCFLFYTLSFKRVFSKLDHIYAFLIHLVFLVRFKETISLVFLNWDMFTFSLHSFLPVHHQFLTSDLFTFQMGPQNVHSVIFKFSSPHLQS